MGVLDGQVVATVLASCGLEVACLPVDAGVASCFPPGNAPSSPSEPLASGRPVDGDVDRGRAARRHGGYGLLATPSDRLVLAPGPAAVG